MTTSAQIGITQHCTRCGRALPATRYEMRLRGREVVPYCPRCALRFGPMLRRSLIIALVGGTLLVAINQGNIILGGDFPSSLYWKIPLTYCVPFGVATTGALLNARSTGPAF